jgi:DNA-directed RNA polymerase subunit RPC12/RpoP
MNKDGRDRPNKAKGGTKMTYATGDKPGKGTYKCTRCGKTIVLEDDTQELPVCPKCHNKKWTKVD